MCLAVTMEEMGNPLTKESSYLVVLDNRNILDSYVTETVVNVNIIEKQQHGEYVQHRLDRIGSRDHSIHNPLRKNKLPLFKAPHKSSYS